MIHKLNNYQAQEGFVKPDPSLTDNQRLKENLRQQMFVPTTIKIALIALTVLVGGCANHRLETYQELRSTEIQQPAYYYTEVEKQIPDTERDPIVEHDQFLGEIEAKVLKYQEQWQAQLESETPMPSLFYDLSTDTMKAYRQLAASPEAARARLAQPMCWNSMWHLDTNGVQGWKLRV